MNIVVTLLVLLALAPAVSAQTTWEIHSTDRGPILDAVVDSIDGDMLAYDGVKRIHLDSINALVRHRLLKGNPGGAVIGLLAGCAVTLGVAYATFDLDLDGDENNMIGLLGLLPPIAGAIIGSSVKRHDNGDPITLSGLSLEQRRATVSGALRDAALEDAAAAAKGR